MHPLIPVGRTLLLGLLMLAGFAQADVPVAPAAGIRAGFGASAGADQFHQTDLVLRLPLRLDLELAGKWSARTAADLALGRLADDDTSAVIGSIGAVMILARQDAPLAFELGVAPTVLSTHRFSRNFGHSIQFTSHAGILARLGDFYLGYRFQHMSNARLARPNPGLNQHLFSILLRL